MLVAKAHRDLYERADGNITKKKFGKNGTMCKEKKRRRGVSTTSRLN